MDRETEARWQRAIIEENPAFSQLMGVRFTSGSRDRIEAELTVGEELANRNGVMHGGAIMAFADILGGAASVLNLPDGARTTTIGEQDELLPSGPARRDGPCGLHSAPPGADDNDLADNDQESRWQRRGHRHSNTAYDLKLARTLDRQLASQSCRHGRVPGTRPARPPELIRIHRP